MSDVARGGCRPDNPDVRHEPSDVSVRAILVTAAALVAVAVVIHLGSWWLFDYLDAREQRIKQSPFPLAAGQRGQLPPEPRLEGVKRMSSQDVDVHRDDQWPPPELRLRDYGWVDPEAGVARMPIEDAMRLIAQYRLLPSRPQNPGGEGEDQSWTLPSRASSGRTPERRGQ